LNFEIKYHLEMLKNLKLIENYKLKTENYFLLYNISMIKVGLIVISTLGLMGFVAVVVLAILFLAKKLFKVKMFDRIASFLRPNAYGYAFFLALIASMASLFLSEVLLFQPCILCWYQRIATYPQVLLLYVALIRKEKILTPYLIVMNIVGGLVSLYHYSLHILPRTLVPILPCSTQLGGVPCDKGYKLYFGFMSFPLMAWSVFALIIFLLIMSQPKSAVRKSSRRKGVIRDSEESEK